MDSTWGWFQDKQVHRSYEKAAQRLRHAVMTKKNQLKAKDRSSGLMWETKKPWKRIIEESDTVLVKIQDLYRDTF